MIAFFKALAEVCPIATAVFLTFCHWAERRAPSRPLAQRRNFRMTQILCECCLLTFRTLWQNLRPLTISKPVMWSERSSVLGQDRSVIKKSVLVLQVWCCVVKHGLVTLVVIMILKDTATFQVLFIVSLFCAWNTVLHYCGDQQWCSLA